MSIKIFKTMWVSVSILLFSMNLYFYFFDNKNPDYGTVMIWGMLVLSFPCGLINVYVFGSLFIFFLKYFSLETEYLVQISVLWIGFVIIGYLQWFKLLPFFILKLKKRASD